MKSESVREEMDTLNAMHMLIVLLVSTAILTASAEHAHLDALHAQAMSPALVAILDFTSTPLLEPATQVSPTASKETLQTALVVLLTTLLAKELVLSALIQTHCPAQPTLASALPAFLDTSLTLPQANAIRDQTTVLLHQALLAALILDAPEDIMLITPLAEFLLAARERITAMLFTMSVLAKLVPQDITRLASSHALKSPLLDAIPQILVLLIAPSARQITSRDSTAQVLSLAAL